jgi:hypothetical protein
MFIILIHIHHKSSSITPPPAAAEQRVLKKETPRFRKNFGNRNFSIKGGKK